MSSQKKSGKRKAPVSPSLSPRPSHTPDSFPDDEEIGAVAYSDVPFGANGGRNVQVDHYGFFYSTSEKAQH